MGKRSKQRVLQLDDGTIERGENHDRDEHDFNATPWEATQALIEAERDRLADFPLIWECAAGAGDMARVLVENGFAVHCSDIVDRGCDAEIRSFYDYVRDDRPSPAVMTNPPFAECNWRDGRGLWIDHGQGLELDYMALLMSWAWPAAGGLKDLWNRYAPARVYLMRWKIDFTGQGSPPALHAWFVWDRQSAGETVLRMLDRPRQADRRQGNLFSS